MKKEEITVDPKREVMASVRPDLDLMLEQYETPGLCEGHPDIGHGGFLTFACPGCGDVGGIGAQHPKVEHSWDIAEGSLSDPLTLTLKPSIHCKGCCGWHGFLIKGKFQMQPT